LEAARLGAERNDAELLELAERAAGVAKQLAVGLAGRPPWDAEADAALAQVELARGRSEAAADHARAAVTSIQSGMHEDQHLRILLPVASVLMATGAPEWEGGVRPHLRRTLAMIAQRTVDEDVRVRWFHAPIGTALTQLAGPLEDLSDLTSGDQPADERDGAQRADVELLRSLVQGKTNREIAEELGIEEAAVTRRLGELFATIGVSSRAEATAFAFHERVL
jgi:DNA-binding CsgD family transcriptional regulator